MENKVKLKIGEIEFEAKGSAEVVERERSVFLNELLPTAVEALVRTRGTERNVQYIKTDKQYERTLTESTDSISMPETKEAGSIDLSRTSLSSFISQYGYISDQDFIVIAAYYDEKKNGTKSFTSETVKQYYSDARRKKYSNFSELLRQLAQKGLIMDNPDAEKKNTKRVYINR